MIAQKLPNKRSYIKFFNGKKLTFLGFPCVIGGYSTESYLIYIKDKGNDNRLTYYCFNIELFVNKLMHNISSECQYNFFHPKVFKLVNRNYIGYDYVMWIPSKCLDYYYNKQIEDIELPLFTV